MALRNSRTFLKNAAQIVWRCAPQKKIEKKNFLKCVIHNREKMTCFVSMAPFLKVGGLAGSAF